LQYLTTQLASLRSPLCDWKPAVWLEARCVAGGPLCGWKPTVWLKLPDEARNIGSYSG
jgi:hypothetical protein